MQPSNVTSILKNNNKCIPNDVWFHCTPFGVKITSHNHSEIKCMSATLADLKFDISNPKLNSEGMRWEFFVISLPKNHE